MAEKGILREFFGSLSADVITKYFLPNVFRKSGEKIDQAFEKRLDEECRKTFAVLVSKMPEPWRTKMNEHYRKATAAYIENKMARLLVMAVEDCEKLEDKLEYFRYVSMLDWDKPRKDDVTVDVCPSVLEELDKLDNDPIPEFFEWGLEKLNEVAKKSIPKVEPRIERLRVPIKSLAERMQERTEELQKRATATKRGGRKPWIF